MSEPEPVAVRAWGELRGEKNLPGTLRVLVAGQAAGGVQCDGTVWLAEWMTAAMHWQCTDHATAEEAVARVIASGWARKLGARKASRVYWSDKAKRRAARSGGAR